jgi:hypothetical protein
MTRPLALGSIRAPLLGSNLVRLIYLDEAGTDRNAPFLCVAGVLIHGDHEWPEVDRRIAGLIEKHIPAADRFGFIFHATDIFHGSGYFDRRKPEWANQNTRLAILCDLASIIDDMSIPLVCGHYNKETFGDGIIRQPDAKSKIMHNAAAVDCLIWADRWLAQFANRISNGCS